MTETGRTNIPREPQVMNTLRTFWEKQSLEPKGIVGISRELVSGISDFRAERNRIYRDLSGEPVLQDNDWNREKISSGVDEVSLRWINPTDPTVEVSAGYIGPHPETGVELVEYTYNNPQPEDDSSTISHMHLGITTYPKGEPHRLTHAVEIEGAYVDATNEISVRASIFERDGEPVKYDLSRRPLNP